MGRLDAKTCGLPGLRADIGRADERQGVELGKARSVQIAVKDGGERRVRRKGAEGEEDPKESHRALSAGGPPKRRGGGNEGRKAGGAPGRRPPDAVKGGRRSTDESAEEGGGGDAEKRPLESVTRNEQRRNRMQSASAINDAEFRSVARGCTNGTEWRQWFIKQGSSGLTQVVAAQQGSLIDATGAERAAGYKAMVDDFAQWGELSEETKKLSKEQMTDQLAELHAACRNRAKVCMDRMNAANGLTAGGKGQGTTIDPATFWKGTVAQRGGRALHDRDRGNDHLVRQLGEHIYDEAGRKLPEVVLHKLRSAEDEKAELAESSDEEEEGGKEEKKKAKKKKGRMTKAALLHRIMILMNSLAAVCTGTVKKSGEIEVKKGCGNVKLDGQAKTVLDCSLAEAQEFAWFLVLLCSTVEVDKVQVTFGAVWERVRTYVNENSEHGYTVASALQMARIDVQNAKSIASDVLQASKSGKGSARKRSASPARGTPPTGKGGKKKEGGDPKGSPATKKAKTKGTSGNAKPNSSGELCWKYHQTGECTFKGKCIHKHVPPGDDTDGDDDRE
jgi:hypothetical protein